jgi:heme/copper-type cytochrome/quinol oxidase subunit 2
MKSIFFFLSLKLTMISFFVMGQQPTSIPTDNEPLRFFDSLTNIIFYIAIPLIIIFFYYLWRRRMAKEAEKEQQDKQQKSVGGEGQR